jgi:acyl-CoA thioesterase
MIDDITGEEIDEQELYGEEDAESVSKDLEENELVSHYEINQSLTGTLEELEEGFAKVLFTATEDMIVDRRGMIHSGFIFGAANYAAMAAVNVSTAILAVSKTNFLAPLSVNDEAYFEATALQKDTRKRNVMVVGYFNNIKFFEGEFTIVVLEHHPLSVKLS